jgi:hypothetical protein
MAVAFRSAAHSAGTGASGAAPVVTKPAGVVDGDFLLAIDAADSYGSGLAALTPPAGWTAIGGFSIGVAGINTTTASTYGYIKAWTKVASAEGASYTWSTLTGSSDQAVSVMAFTGVDTATPVQALAAANYGSSNTAATTATAPTLTPGATAGALLVSAFHQGADAAIGATTWTPPTGMTEASDVSASGMYANLETTYLAGLAASTATGAKSATSSGSFPWGGLSILLLPAAAAAAPTKAKTVPRNKARFRASLW